MFWSSHAYFSTKCINKLVVFYPRWNIDCQQSSHQKQRYHPAPRASGSVLFFSTRLCFWQLHACTLAEVKAVTSEGTVKSQPKQDDVGVLPTIIQMFPISWTSSAFHTHFICWVWSGLLTVLVNRIINGTHHANSVQLSMFLSSCLNFF